MPTDLNTIRQRIIKEFNQIIPPNDPILITVFLSDIMLESALKTLHEQQNLMVRNIITARHAMVEEEKKTAGKLITEATTYIKTEINEEISKNLNAVSRQMQNYKKKNSKYLTSNLT